MDTKAIQSQINKVAAEILQLEDRNYFTVEQELLKRPALERKLEELNNEYLIAFNNTSASL